jgi:hypothetical protein
MVVAVNDRDSNRPALITVPDSACFMSAVNGSRQVDIARVADWLAVVQCLDLRDLVGMAFEQIGELPNQLAAISW